MPFGLQGLTKSIKRFKTLNCAEVGCIYPFRSFERILPRGFMSRVVFNVLAPTVLLTHFSDRS